MALVWRRKRRSWVGASASPRRGAGAPLGRPWTVGRKVCFRATSVMEASIWRARCASAAWRYRRVNQAPSLSLGWRRVAAAEEALREGRKVHAARSRSSRSFSNLARRSWFFWASLNRRSWMGSLERGRLGLAETAGRKVHSASSRCWRSFSRASWALLMASGEYSLALDAGLRPLVWGIKLGVAATSAAAVRSASLAALCWPAL
mmetsp:Transcript_27250/g.49293  ORF Transcript_27250/g.49293 Transcript_27250/m.49293 type:complete len:205 (+) Transcript_27250:402-1016(+)